MSHQTLGVDGVRFVRSNFQLGPISFEVYPGETTCLVGPNGSGKTTTLDLIAGTLKPHAGSVSLNQRRTDVAKRTFLKDCGVVHDDPSMLIDELTAREYWRMCGAIRTRDSEQLGSWLEAAEALAVRLDFNPSTATIRSFSHGMRKKTQIVAALMHEPKLVIVDELRNGLDPIAGRRAEQVLDEALNRGASLLAATHDLFWAERQATKVVILSGGIVVAKGDPASLLAAGEDSLEDAFFRIVGVQP